jgi:hypothetical protein
MQTVTCSKCAEGFELEGGKPGAANICPNCFVLTPKQWARLLADDQDRRKSAVAAVQTNIRHHKREREAESRGLHLRSVT